MVGIIQEQNPDRCRLFMQWQQMEWPVLVDTFDLLEVSLVPLTYAIDEHGIVRFAGLRMADAAMLAERFVDREWPAPTAVDDRPETAPDWQTPAGRAALFDPSAIESAIEIFRRRTTRDPRDGWAHFRLAVAYRLREESAARRPEDFQRAVDHWQLALGIDPNNYIWRRRIQQYGPRLAKPYPFYDWVEAARQEIRARGEVPASLVTEPSGSEIAQPSRAFEVTGGQDAPPDPDDRLFRDRATADEPRLIDVEVTTIPRRVRPGSATRAHFAFRPNGSRMAHWNNESEPLRVWVDPPTGWRLDRQLLDVGNAGAATSTELRHIEVEIEVPASAQSGAVSIPAYAVYYVCEDRDGVCMVRRQDLEIMVTVLD